MFFRHWTGISFRGLLCITTPPKKMEPLTHALFISGPRLSANTSFLCQAEPEGDGLAVFGTRRSRGPAAVVAAAATGSSNSSEHQAPSTKHQAPPPPLLRQAGLTNNRKRCNLDARYHVVCCAKRGLGVSTQVFKERGTSLSGQ